MNLLTLNNGNPGIPFDESQNRELKHIRPSYHGIDEARRRLKNSSFGAEFT
jgi:hypothetical protein